MLRILIASTALLPLALLIQDPAPPSPHEPPTGPFGLSMIATPDGRPADIDDFYLSEDCGLCHPRQLEELEGSMHSAAHHDPFYRAFAEMARREAGPEVYAYCSGCHSAAGVVSGWIPKTPEEDLPDVAKAGVTCSVCHLVSGLTGHQGPWGEPGNASFVLDPGRTVRGPIADITRTPAHDAEAAEFLGSSEFCASCHTIIHPINGLRIEHTYEEWKNSIYAEKGIQCQDCHMRSVEDAVRVAETLEPVTEKGTWALKGPERTIRRHTFVGGNVNAGVLAHGPWHGKEAEARLKSAATLEVQAPSDAVPGETIDLTVVVTNVAAGHNLPTSLTELREMWVHLVVRDASGAVLLESGALDEEGEIPEHAIRFGAHTVDANGKLTVKPWEAVDFSWKRLVPPKGSTSDRLTFQVPPACPAPWTVEASLYYRSAPPWVIREVMGEDAFEQKTVEMASTGVEIAARER